MIFEEYNEFIWNGKDKLPLIVSFGAGVDSTAILVKLYEIGMRPDYILFSDTGAERPDIYQHIKRVDKWLEKVGFPKVTRVGNKVNLLDEMEKAGDLPSLAFGFKTCSQKHKIAPQNKYIHNDLKILKYVNIVGYGTGEIDRAEKSLRSIKDGKIKFYKGEDKKLWFPLIDWKLNREDCKALSRAIGFCTSKSSCFFCPATKKEEISILAEEYPDLIERALALEDKFKAKQEERYDAEVEEARRCFGDRWQLMSIEDYEEQNVKFPQKSTVKGLGRNWSWRGFLESKPDKLDMFNDVNSGIGCGCIDL